MPYIIGFILGDLLNRIGFFRAAGAALLLAATGFLAHRLIGANLDPALSQAGAIAAPAALFAWAVWNPAASRLRLWIVDGVYLTARLAMWWALMAFAVALAEFEFRIGDRLTQAWSMAGAAACLWGVQLALERQTARSHRLAGDRSVVEV